MTQTLTHQSILGVILAGGQGRRMHSNRPKWQLPLGSKPIIEHIISRFQPQVGTLVINGQHPELESYPYPLVQDITQGAQGPLAGLLTGLHYARQHALPWVATCPCDSPFIPRDYVKQLVKHVSSTACSGAIIQSQGRLHPVFGLWSIELYHSLKATLETTEHRALGYWCKQIHTDIITLEYSDQPSSESFTNINTPEEWQAAQHYWLSLQPHQTQ